MDAKDILGIRGAPPAAPSGRKPKEPSAAKPKGVSREVWQITQGYSTDNFGPAPVIPTGLKEKWKTPSKRKVTWEWKGFTSSARTDGLTLKHWVKRAEGGGPLLRPGSNGGDVGGDYAFAKYNKKVDMLRYNDEEYELYCNSDPSWTRAETDYLFDLCLRLDLRFIVIADRYEWPNVSRSVEDLKSRYYGIAQRLVEARADFPEQAAAHPVCADPFNAAHERERKDDLAALLSRSAAREREETELLAKAAEIEAARKVEIEAARAAGKAFGFGSRSSGRFPDLRPDHAPLVDIEQEVGGPILATAVYGQDRPPPGVYPRGLHTISVANEALPPGGAGTRPRDKKGADAWNRKVDLAMEELGVKPPSVATRAVCRAWFRLRYEVSQLLDLRQALARKQRDMGLGIQSPTGGNTGGTLEPNVSFDNLLHLDGVPPLGSSLSGSGLAAAAAAGAGTPGGAAAAPAAAAVAAAAAAAGGAAPAAAMAAAPPALAVPPAGGSPAAAGAAGGPYSPGGQGLPATPKGQRAARTSDPAYYDGAPPSGGSGGAAAAPQAQAYADADAGVRSGKRDGKRKTPARYGDDPSPPRKPDKRAKRH